MIESQNGVGFHAIESFFSGIFGCGGGCNIVPCAASTDAGRSFASLRPIPSVVPRDFQANHSKKHFSVDGCFSGNKENQHRDQREVMIACDDDDEDESSCSFLNETGTTHVDSSFLDESSTSLSMCASIGCHDGQRLPLQTFREPPRLRPEREMMMLPIETVVGTWPPSMPPLPERPEMMVQEQHKQKQNHSPGTSTKEKKQDEVPHIAFPVRPPKIRRLTLDDALSMELAPSLHHKTSVTSLSTQIHDRDPVTFHSRSQLRSAMPVIPEAFSRSRSLDFLFSSSSSFHRNRRSNLRRDRARLQELGYCTAQEGSFVSFDHPNHQAPRYQAYNDNHHCCEEQPSHRHLSEEMLADLNDTYLTL